MTSTSWIDPMTEPLVFSKDGAHFTSAVNLNKTAISDAALHRLTQKHELEDIKFACDHYEKCECGIRWKEHCKYCQEPKAAHILKMRDYPRTTQVERADHLPLLWALLAGGVALAVMAVRRILGRLLS